MKIDVKSLKNLDKAKLKAFFLMHGEKVGFGFFMICFLLLLKSAIGVPMYDKEPEDLQALAEQKQSQIASATFNADSLGIVVPDFVSELSKLTDTRRAKPVRITTNFTTPLIENRGRRGNPPRVAMPRPKATYNWGVLAYNPLPQLPLGPEELLALEQDRLADVGSEPPPPMRVSDEDREGILALPDFVPDMKPPGGARLEARQWIVVTGKIPVAEQLAKFREAFKNTQKLPADEEVRYEGFEIQRAEVSSPTAAIQKEDWKPVNLSALGAEVAEWSIGAVYPPLVDTPYLDPNMAMNLPPMVGRNHGEEVAYPPEIPLKSTAPVGAVAAPVAAAPAPRAATPFGAANPQANVAPQAAVPAKPEGPPPLLFRLFDFTAKEGRYYRYRVRLVLRNPNYNAPRQYLKPPKEGQQPLHEIATLKTDWSKASQAVMVRRDDSVLAGAVKPGSRSALDDTLQVLVHEVDPDSGFYVVNEFNCGRGQLLNFQDEKVVVENLTNPQGLPTEEMTSVRTKLTLVDMLGGDSRQLVVQTKRGNRVVPLRVSAKAPAEALVVAPDGQMLVRDELDDFHRLEEQRLRQLEREMRFNREPIEKKDQVPGNDPFNPLLGR